MKLYKFIAVLFSSALLFGLAMVANADPPTQDGVPPPGKGSTGPAQVQPASVVLDPTTANVTRLELSKEDSHLPDTPHDNLTGQRIIPAAFQEIKFEDFEGDFPNNWESFDGNGPTGGEHVWTDVNCFARTGSWSAWPAGLDGANGVNPCSPDLAQYPNDVNAWLIYGPFSLEGAQAAFFDIYLRMVAEQCNPIVDCDYLFWGASTNGVDFDGWATSGTRSGTEGNGYDFDTLDFSNVPDAQGTFHNLLGQPQVWVAIVFRSDFSITFQGPFIDDVSIIFEAAGAPTLTQLFLPLILQSPPPVTPKTNLYVFNNTGGTLTYYRVFGSKLNGVPIPDITCTNVPAGATRFCGTLDTSTYDLKFEGVKCSLQARRALEQGNHTREARCPSPS